MTTRDEGRPSGAQQADALDAFLNGLAHGNPPPETDVDPALARTARRLQGLADATLDAHLDNGRGARTWEALMRDASTRPPLIAVPAAVLSTQHPGITTTSPAMSSGGRSGAPAAVAWARVVPLRTAAPPSRLRRVGSQSLGLVATLTLVAMIGLSGLAVYLSAPQRNEDPESRSILAGASPTADTAPVDSQEIFYGPCDVAPRDYDELMAMVAARIVVADPVVPASVAISSTAGGGNGPPRYQLPDGGAVPPETRAPLVALLGSWANCTPFLRTALSTDSFLVRSALEGPVAGPVTFFWWLYSHPDAVPSVAPETAGDHADVPRPGDSELAAPGTPTNVFAYGLRLLDDRHIAAYLASPFLRTRVTGEDVGPEVVGPPQYEEGGYVVFARQPDGRWLVDEWQLNRRAADTPYPEASATPVSP